MQARFAPSIKFVEQCYKYILTHFEDILVHQRMYKVMGTDGSLKEAPHNIHVLKKKNVFCMGKQPRLY